MATRELISDHRIRVEIEKADGGQVFKVRADEVDRHILYMNGQPVALFMFRGPAVTFSRALLYGGLLAELADAADAVIGYFASAVATRAPDIAKLDGLLRALDAEVDRANSTMKEHAAALGQPTSPQTGEVH